jgi:hypothetical protein
MSSILKVWYAENREDFQQPFWQNYLCCTRPSKLLHIQGIFQRLHQSWSSMECYRQFSCYWLCNAQKRFTSHPPGPLAFGLVNVTLLELARPRPPHPHILSCRYYRCFSVHCLIKGLGSYYQRRSGCLTLPPRDVSSSEFHHGFISNSV